MVPKKDIYNVSFPRTNGDSELNSHLALNSLEDSYHEIDRVVFFSDNERYELAEKVRVGLLELKNILKDKAIDEDKRERVKYIAFLIGKLEKARNKDEYLRAIDNELNLLLNSLNKDNNKNI